MSVDGVLARITPSNDERAALAEDVAALVVACQSALDAAGLAGSPSVQGSVAKDTWIAGSNDIDLFLLLDPSVPEETLKQAAFTVGEVVLDDPARKYAQHPYLVGTFRGRSVDLVPAYAVADAAQRMSAVDRTPFHTAWVAAHLDARARGDVRLAKQWMKGVGVYGAQTSVGGFSGYLVEVLIARFGSFDGLLDWLVADAQPRALGAAPEGVLTVPDPVDAKRNCAAAVQEATLALASEAARAYRDEPGTHFFFPAPPRTEPPGVLAAALASQGAVWLGIDLAVHVDVLDTVLPQYQRSCRQAAEALERAGFPVIATDVHDHDDETRVALQWVVADVTLPATKHHTGPPADSTHAQRFIEKWNGHPDAVAPPAPVDGKMAVDIHVRARTPAAWLAANMGVLTGKHVIRALQDNPPLLTDPADAGSWAPRVADVILHRRPWER